VLSHFYDEQNIAEFVQHYPPLAFVNPTKIEGPKEVSTTDKLPHVTTYTHEKELRKFLEGESQIFKEATWKK